MGSKGENVQLECPSCRAAASQRVYAVIDAKLDRQIAKQLRSGMSAWQPTTGGQAPLFTFACGACGHVARIVHPCRYRDDERQFTVQLAPGGAEAVLDELQALADRDPKVRDHRLRVVTTARDFLERVLVLRAKLNDGVIEFLKLAALATTDLRGSELRFDRTEDDKNLSFVVLREGAEPSLTTLSREAYDGLRDGPGAELAKFARRKGKWCVIDSRTVSRFLPKS